MRKLLKANSIKNIIPFSYIWRFYWSVELVVENLRIVNLSLRFYDIKESKFRNLHE